MEREAQTKKMTIPYLRVLYKSKNENSYSPLTSIDKVSTAEALDAKTNNASVDLTNPWNKYTTDPFNFDVDDLIEIYAENVAISTATDTPIFTGIVSEIKPDTSQGGRRLSVKLQDRTALLLGRRWAKGFDTMTAPNIVNSLVSWANGAALSNNMPLMNLINVDTLRPTTLIDGSTVGGDAFPTKSLHLGWKTVYEYLREVSQTPFLNTTAEQTSGVTPVNKPFMFWVGRQASDGTVPLYWTTRQNATVSSYPIREGQEGVYSINLRKSVHDVVNMIIFGCGQDLKGNGITWYTINDQSNLPELRSRYMNFVDIRDALIQEKIDEDTKTTLDGAIVPTTTTISLTSATSFSTSGAIIIDDEFVTYSGKSSNDLTGCERGKYGTAPKSHVDDTAIFAADAMSTITNTTFRQELRQKGSSKALRFMQGLEGLIWKGQIKMRGNNRYSPGDYVTLYSPSYNINNLNVRITNVKNDITRKGWTTTLTVEEEVTEQTKSYYGT